MQPVVITFNLLSNYLLVGIEENAHAELPGINCLRKDRRNLNLSNSEAESQSEPTVSMMMRLSVTLLARFLIKVTSVQFPHHLHSEGITLSQTNFLIFVFSCS